MERDLESKQLVENEQLKFWQKYRTIVVSIIFVTVITLIVIILIIFLYIIPNNNDESNGGTVSELVVSTSYGNVEGFYLNVTLWNGNVSTVKAWRGIPFASPPIDNLRWMSPIAPAKWEGVLACKEFKPECIQAATGSGSEDCLYLNVYTSIEAEDNGPWPVYFDIYGGGLMGGSATANFNGLINSDVAERGGRGLVVVAAAYRLNLFGFLATSELSQEQNGTSGNYGIQDQQLALKWIQENIKNFNGDPNNVIIGGQSSGGTSVFALLSSPLSNGLFHAAMSYSGSTNLTIDLATAQKQNADIVTSSGCSLPGYTYEEINACMRNLSSSAIYSLIPEDWNTPGIWALPAGPNGQNYAGVVIVDGKVITNSFSNALEIGLVDVPFLFGHMGFEPDESPDDYIWSYNASQWHGMLNQTFQSWNDGEIIANEIYKLYLNDSVINPQRAYDRIVADYGLYCSQIILTRKALAPLGNYKNNIFLYYHGKLYLKIIHGFLF